MRETCMYSLSGGRRPARQRASSDPTPEAWRKPCDRATGDGIGRGRTVGEDGWEEKGNQMSKDEGGRNSSFSEKPVRSRRRRLVDWINPTGAKKVHSLVDKVYQRKNLEMAWEKVKANRGSGGVDGQNLEAFVRAARPAVGSAAERVEG